jgi:hypothetical protein
MVWIEEEGIVAEVGVALGIIIDRSVSDSTPGYLPSPKGRSMLISESEKIAA